MKNLTIKAAGLAFSFCVLNSGLAQPAHPISADAAASALSTPDIGVSLLRVLGALALVLGIFLAGVWLFRNWQRFAVRRGRAPKLNILESRSLGGRQAIYVVAYEQERFLLSSSPSGVNFLTPLAAAGEGEPGVPESRAAVSFSQAFARVLKARGVPES